MENSDLSRREFQRLAAAAFGGMVLGAGAQRIGAAEDKKEEEVNPLLDEPHVCRGLNTCKDKDNDGKNACAGQGECATANIHSCHTKNECKGQGGCGKTAGENACKGKGECAVPLGDKVWTKTRKRFEELMTKAGKKVGPAPKPKKK